MDPKPFPPGDNPEDFEDEQDDEESPDYEIPDEYEDE